MVDGFMDLLFDFKIYENGNISKYFFDVHAILPDSYVEGTVHWLSKIF